MAVELGASRLLAPYFSSSQIVWTIIIGTIMIAMALGNVYGGRSADKHPDPDTLYKRLLVSAVWIAAIPFLGKLAILLISGLLVVTVNTNFLIWAAFLSCMLVFVYPLFLLGTVTPSLVKYSVSSLDDSGKTVGTLGAANTIGSIIGTFVPTFLSIPAVGTAATFVIFSGIMLVLAAIYFLSVKRGTVRLIVCTVLFIAASVAGLSFGFAFWDSTLTLEDESIYNYLQVRENDKQVILSTNVLFGVQSVYEKTDSLTGMYYDYALAAPLMAEKRDSLLILGMGTGTYATQCGKYYPEMRTEGVEIDEKITDLARNYFALDPSVPVTTYDGRAFLGGTDQKYDVIMVDAYQDITIPFQMSSVEFFRMVRSHLTENGVMIVNMNMTSKDENGINAYLQDTIASVFSDVYTVDVARATNRELFASQDPNMIRRLEARTEDLLGAESVAETRLGAMMQTVLDNLQRYEGGGRILTDDKAPVELLGMRAIDDMISGQLAYYKKRFEEEGIKGIIGDWK
ncbi:MAG: fused MFS/spermidine synthase [Oscillospiraceae bacterium]|nr:fused MFS/spermidine synthase [Oscillospiraceae bacterium]